MSRLVLLIGTICLSLPAQTLDIQFIDTEGGQATLIVTPSRQSLLIDAGYAGFEGRDTNRILAAARKAGLSKIDYMFLTHYHGDHIGGIEPLSEKIPIGTFLDHGPNRDTAASAKGITESYARAAAKGKHVVMKPGDKIPLDGVEVTVLAADGAVLSTPLAGAGRQNPLCASVARKNEDTSPNALSAGFVLQFGQFRFVDLGDLTWNKELGLACPVNQIGKADVFLAAHHGLADANSQALVHALEPRVAILNNGAKKGWAADTMQVLRGSPGLRDLWQLHFALAGKQETNTSEPLIANMEEKCQGHGLSLSASRDGSFTMVNERNGQKKAYRKRLP